MTKKKKFNKRRALICKLAGASKNNRGYFKYNVTIGEKDGKLTRLPAYGKDMQDALQRLLWKERTDKVENKLTAGWIFVAWLATMAWPAFVIGDTQDPTFLLFSLGSVFTIIAMAAWWWSWVNKQ